MRQGKYAQAREIISLLEDELSAAGFDLLDVRLFRGGGRLQVRVYVDTPAGIDLDECARASRTVDMLLEEADLIRERYVIEVSSPGIRRPLRKPDHFTVHRGQKVEVVIGPATEPRKLRGELVDVTSENIQILTRAPTGNEEALLQALTLTYEEILEANLDADFDARALIQADRRRRKEERRSERRQRGESKAKRRPKP